MASDEVRGKLSVKFFEGADGVRCQLAEPNSRRALQRCREDPTHDRIRYSLKVHQGLECL